MDGKTLTICNASAGSGKTFTLAAFYVACLVQSPNKGVYRSILAVTFTNKATAEMKDRILTHLYALAQNYPDTHFLGKVQEVLRERGYAISEAEIRRRAALLFEDMLAHYDDIHVTTIDSFLHLLFTGLAQSIGLTSNFSIELDKDHAISTAVDQILSTHIDEQEGLISTVSDFLNEQLDDESDWDIRSELRKLADELFKESVQERTTEDDFNRRRISAFKETVKWDKTPAALQLKAAYNVLLPYENQLPMLKGGRNYSAFFRRVETMVKGHKIKYDDKALSETDRNRLDKPDMIPEHIAAPLRRLNDLFASQKGPYMCWYYTVEHLNRMMLLTYLRKRIEANLHETNTVLLAETAHKLAEALRPGDADFILEKAGIRFRHILLDEFQDTSTLQWRNFSYLIKEILSGGGTTLIVGDTKQSIYRWRNGNRHIMESLNESHPDFGSYYCARPLRRNFRSRREIVQFNLRLFRQIPGLVQTASGQPVTLYDEGFTDTNLDEYYVGGAHEGGYVFFRAYMCNKERARTRDAIVYDMFTRMEELLGSGVKSKDILILIRKGANAEPVIRIFRQLKNDAAFPFLSRCEIVSGDSFTLEGSRSVLMAISGLKYIMRRDSVARAHLLLCRPDIDMVALESVKRNMPLTEMLEEVIRICLCPNGVYEGDDVIYLDTLQDKVREYVGQYGAAVDPFLTYWDDTMHTKTIGAAETSAIRLMTIHKAKGLEAANVFIPFCDWGGASNKHDQLLWCQPAEALCPPDKRLSLVPIRQERGMQEAGYSEEYQREQDEEQIDDINLLYVALTRAADRLFVYTGLPQKLPETVGALMLRACELETSFADLQEGEFVELEAGECFPQRKTEDSAPSRQQLPQPFSFSDAEPVPAVYRRETVHVEFRQSQDSFQYTMYGTDQGQTNIDQRAFGNICHDILAEAVLREDLPRIIDRFAAQGIIRDEEVRRRVETMLGNAWRHDRMCEWFSGKYTLLREDTILLPERLRRQFTAEERSLDHAAEEVTELRPDRVMTLGTTAIVLDYKFGAMNERIYFPQVRRYMLLMRELGYQHVEGYIWAAASNELIPVYDQNTSAS